MDYESVNRGFRKSGGNEITVSGRLKLYESDTCPADFKKFAQYGFGGYTEYYTENMDDIYIKMIMAVVKCHISRICMIMKHFI